MLEAVEFGVLSEDEFKLYLEEGYIECKKTFLKKKMYVITEKGKEFMEQKMLDKIRYIQ
jgi:DNA-binding PadR family transcriptional regulator